MTHLKISVVTWDAGFREHFHTVDAFANQTIPKDDYEFIWVDYYNDITPELQTKLGRISNAKALLVNGNGQWRLATCLNYGTRNCSGELLVIPDGDIVVTPDFLSKILEAHSRIDNLVLYIRRWDEPQQAHNPAISVEHLDKVCEVKNATNYGGCITLRKHVLEYVNGYEEHHLFAGASATSMELYIRLKNAGFPIMWHPTVKIYHPWHANTGTPAQKIEQEMWLMSRRNLAINFKASSDQVDTYLKEYDKLLARNGIMERLGLINLIASILDTVGLRPPISKLLRYFKKLRNHIRKSLS